MCLLKLKLSFTVVVDETSALPQVYQNSFTTKIMQAIYKIKYSPNSTDVLIKGNRSSCKSCYSTEPAVSSSFTALLNDSNLSTSNMNNRAIPTTSPRWYIFWLNYRPPVRVYISRAVYYITPPLSLVTNSLSIAVFYRMRRKLHDGLFLVFVAFSVVDTFALTSRFDMILRSISLKLSLFTYNVGCQLFTWIREFCQVCSSYLLLLSTIERFVSLRFPLKRAIICSGRRIRIAVLCIFFPFLKCIIYF